MNPQKRISGTHSTVDDGKRVGEQKCPQCGSTDFFQTVSREHCNACGYDIDYWKGQDVKEGPKP